MPSPQARSVALVLAITAGLVGCSGTQGTGRVRLQLSSRASSTGSMAAGQATIALGGDQIVLDQVELVLRKVKGEGAESCPVTPGSTEADVAGEDCGEFSAGPTLFDLPLGEGVVPTFTATVPAGSYREVQLQIHRPVDQTGDAAFLLAHPEFAGTSIRVTGTWQPAGDPAPTPFTYTTDLTSVINVELPQPVTVAAGSDMAVTLSIDLSGWFANGDGTGLVDPAQALDGQPLESLVEQHIRSSFRAFEDENKDGEAD
jgi:hypothetical protein